MINNGNRQLNRKTKSGNRRWKSFVLTLVVLHGINLIAASSAIAATTSSPPKTKKLKSDRIRLPIFQKPSNPHSLDLSPDAVQLASTLQLSEKLLKLKERQQQVQSAGGSVPIELRQDLTETKVDIIETIEQARLEIDFVAAEIEEEQASIEEVLKWYTNERDERVNNANRWAFRTNGVLWAAAEAFTIPSYKHPRYSIPSGALGIVAGLVPTLFSEAANRSLGGMHHERKAYPNMLCKFYDLPTSPRTEYPVSVWTHLNLPPAGGGTKSRRDMLMEHWLHNDNIHTLSTGISEQKIKRIVGIDQSDISIDLLSDRASMLRELKACVLQMTRPLMELSMCLRDKKQVSGRLIGDLESTGSDSVPDP
jgi:hypothetical protein